MRELLNGFRLFLFVLLVLSLFLPSFATAQSGAEPVACAPPNYRTDTRPDASGASTVVDLGVRVVDLLEINDVNQTISVDVAVRMRWTDPRLKDWEGCRLSILDIWFPELGLKNSGRLFSRWPETVSVEGDGQITYLQRLSGTFSSYQKLEDFPFNQADISMWLFVLDWSASKVALRIDEDFTGISQQLNISDWQILGVDKKLIDEEFEAVGQTHSAYVLTISAKRYIGYYIWKIMIPITLIVFMSWSVFFIPPTQFGTQIGLSASSVLTLIAFIFATTNMLPRLGYLTALDKFIIGATVLVFLALLQCLISGYLAGKGHVQSAARVDFVSRFVFPMLFLAVCTKVYLDHL
jgi:hypothetical protein